MREGERDMRGEGEKFERNGEKGEDEEGQERGKRRREEIGTDTMREKVRQERRQGGKLREGERDTRWRGINLRGRKERRG